MAIAATLAMCAKVELADAALDAANDAADIPWDRVRSPALDHAAEQADEAFTAVARQCAPALAARLRAVMEVMSTMERWTDTQQWADEDLHPANDCAECDMYRAFRAATAKLEAL